MQAQKLVGTYYLDARKEEFQQRKKELADKHRKRNEALGDKIKNPLEKMKLRKIFYLQMSLLTLCFYLTVVALLDKHWRL